MTHATSVRCPPQHRRSRHDRHRYQPTLIALWPSSNRSSASHDSRSAAFFPKFPQLRRHPLAVSTGSSPERVEGLSRSRLRATRSLNWRNLGLNAYATATITPVSENANSVPRPGRLPPAAASPPRSGRSITAATPTTSPLKARNSQGRRQAGCPGRDQIRRLDTPGRRRAGVGNALRLVAVPYSQRVILGDGPVR